MNRLFSSSRSNNKGTKSATLNGSIGNIAGLDYIEQSDVDQFLVKAKHQECIRKVQKHEKNLSAVKEEIDQFADDNKLNKKSLAKKQKLRKNQQEILRKLEAARKKLREFAPASSRTPSGPTPRAPQVPKLKTNCSIKTATQRTADHNKNTTSTREHPVEEEEEDELEASVKEQQQEQSEKEVTAAAECSNDDDDEPEIHVPATAVAVVNAHPAAAAAPTTTMVNDHHHPDVVVMMRELHRRKMEAEAQLVEMEVQMKRMELKQKEMQVQAAMMAVEQARVELAQSTHHHRGMVPSAALTLEESAKTTTMIAPYGCEPEEVDAAARNEMKGPTTTTGSKSMMNSPMSREPSKLVTLVSPQTPPPPPPQSSSVLTTTTPGAFQQSNHSTRSSASSSGIGVAINNRTPRGLQGKKSRSPTRIRGASPNPMMTDVGNPRSRSRSRDP